MLHLECDVRTSSGLRETDVIAVVADHAGVKEQIQVEKSFLVSRVGRFFLPVWGVTQDYNNKLVEVELPQESVAGTNRIWVKPEQLFYQQETALA